MSGPHIGGEKRLFFINRFYYPDHGATAQILSDVAEHLAASGWQVHVLTSRLSYSDPRTRYQHRASRKGVKIIRLPTTGFGRGNLIGRTIDYLSFYVACVFGVLKHVRKADLIVIKTDPPMLSVPVSFAARLKRAHSINWIQDLFPDVADELGVPLARGWIGKGLKILRNRSFRTAVTNIVIGERMAERLAGEGIVKDQIRIIPNFTDDTTIHPGPMGWQDLRRAWGYKDEDFVIGYSGNLGRAHEVATMLDAAQHLHDNPRIKFLFVGGGHLRQQVEAEVELRQLTSVSFQPYQPRATLAASLSVPNMHWISLQPQLEGLVLPSKLYGAAAVGRPICMIGDKDGDIGRIIAKHNIGYCFEPGESDALARMILDLAVNIDRQRDLGRAARHFVDAHASREHAFALWQAMLEEA